MAGANLRRYFNGYWRRGQMRVAPILPIAFRSLARQPSNEITGFKYRTARGQHLWGGHACIRGQDRTAICRFFNSLMQHAKQTGAEDSCGIA